MRRLKLLNGPDNAWVWPFQTCVLWHPDMALLSLMCYQSWRSNPDTIYIWPQGICQSNFWQKFNIKRALVNKYLNIIILLIISTPNVTIYYFKFNVWLLSSWNIESVWGRGIYGKIWSEPGHIFLCILKLSPYTDIIQFLTMIYGVLTLSLSPKFHQNFTLPPYNSGCRHTIPSLPYTIPPNFSKIWLNVTICVGTSIWLSCYPEILWFIAQ